MLKFIIDPTIKNFAACRKFPLFLFKKKNDGKKPKNYIDL